MKTEINRLADSQIEIEIENSSEEFNGFIQQAIEKLGESLEVKGFRKGNAPKEVVEREIGAEKLLTEASDLAIREGYKKSLVENEIEPISQPKVEIKKIARGDSFIFTITLLVFPEIELPDYKNIASQSERKRVVVEENEIKSALEWLQKSRAKFTLKNGSAEKGDFIEIEYQTLKDQRVEGVEESNMNKQKPVRDSFILGENQLMPELEEKLIGMAVEDGEKEFSITIPRNNSSNILAKIQKEKGSQKNQVSDDKKENVKFKVKINSIQRVEFAEIDDKFAMSLGKFENLEALKKSIKDGLSLEKEETESQRIRKEILDNISKEVDYKAPAVLVEREQNEMMKSLKSNVSEKLNISFEDYLDKIKKSEKEIIDSFFTEANQRIKNFFILREIAKKEKIEISDQEIGAETQKLLKNIPNINKAEKDFDSENIKEYAKEKIRNEKVFQLLEQFINIS
jgi:trigger factor